ncbi:hypothetical protein CKM354_000131400 [Cercospora kikuchii]|uniref:CCR4-Not complex 3'-5'-exoribonuclease subunit Ccr4 n=1 Tax=Cercospora kikuchii TaxID=84275 RepID=A0A9P3C5K0_9PEZI|nr:uncharacterized protein CKM354_000131400 [Cercospora kikuchii]GIZ37884.1 hypothetical protein CKM354_000131400 [Cercospora kikuchii]
MADGFNRFNPGHQYLYQNHNSHTRGQQLRNGSPVNTNGARIFHPNADTPSPNRSPGTNSPAHNPYSSMYNHGTHRPNHTLLNGAAHQNFQPQQTALGKAFQSSMHGANQHHMNNQHHDHGMGGHANTFGNHQHSISTSTLSNTTPHFTPAHLQNGTPENSLGKPHNEHWAEQLREYSTMKMADPKVHYYARNAPGVTRLTGRSSNNTANKNDSEEHGERKRIIDEDDFMGPWGDLDFSGHGLKVISTIVLERYPKLKKLYLPWNKLTSIPPQIGTLRFLTILDLSWNNLSFLPPEIGMLTNLKKLLLYDNNLDDLPHEFGTLYQLEMLGLEGNPMRHDYKDRLVEHGTQELIRYIREQAPTPEPPVDRAWIPLVEESTDFADSFTLLSWNILCDRAASATMYGYTPSEALSWQRRRDMILDEMKGRAADIMCLQEMDVENFAEFFRPNLSHTDYKGVFFPKSRAQTMRDEESKNVDGCAIFWKNSKYIVLDKQFLVFSQEAIRRPDMKGEHDVYNRIMPRDHVAIVLFLENRETGSRLIVANTHLTWEPWHSDIKIIQVAILMEHIQKLSEKYAKWPALKDAEKKMFEFGSEDNADGTANVPIRPGPSLKYDESTHIPLIICGDFNSTSKSGVYDLITQGSLSNSYEELGKYSYGDFTRNGMSHPFSLKSAYSHIGEMKFTNYTPDFRQVIDWQFYSTQSMQVTGLLGEVDKDYMKRVPGFPNHYFPSDHLPLMTQFAIKEKKERKVTETDFGNSRRN